MLMPAPIDKSVFRKIKKLLALAGSPNANEAAAALNKARRLMDEHGLSQTTVDLASLEETRGYRLRNGAKTQPTWLQRLLGLVGLAFGCKPLLRQVRVSGWAGAIRRESYISYLGPAERAELAAYAFAVLYRQLVRDRSEMLALLRDAGLPGRTERIRRADWYCEGWVAGVNQVLHKFELTPEEAALLEAWSQEQKLPTAAVRKEDAPHPKAGAFYQAGLREGSQAQLYRPVNGRGPGLDQPAAIGHDA